MTIDLKQVNTNIKKLIPHRYPMLLVDRVLEVIPGETILALKNTTFNEPFYSGHFPNYPIMPGVLILEAAAQAAGIMVKLNFTEESENDLFVFAAADQVKFKKQVVPGDSLYIRVNKIQHRSTILKAEAKLYLNREESELAFSAIITLAWTKK